MYILLLNSDRKFFHFNARNCKDFHNKVQKEKEHSYSDDVKKSGESTNYKVTKLFTPFCVKLYTF